MKSKNLLIAAGMMFLATACKENETIGPAAEPIQIEIRNPQELKPNQTDEPFVELLEMPTRQRLTKPDTVDVPQQNNKSELPGKAQVR